MLSLLTSALSDLRSMNLRQLLLQLVSLGLIVTSALVIWKSLMLVTGSDSPVVVVLSGSMEPAFYRGDILFLYLAERATRVGEIVVFNIKGREIPIVHRVITTIVMTPCYTPQDRIGYWKTRSWAGQPAFFLMSGESR